MVPQHPQCILHTSTWLYGPRSQPIRGLLRSRRAGLLGGSDLLRGLTVAHVLGAGLEPLDVPVHGTGDQRRTMISSLTWLKFVGSGQVRLSSPFCISLYTWHCSTGFYLRKMSQIESCDCHVICTSYYILQDSLYD